MIAAHCPDCLRAFYGGDAERHLAVHRARSHPAAPGPHPLPDPGAANPIDAECVACDAEPGWPCRTPAGDPSATHRSRGRRISAPAKHAASRPAPRRREVAAAVARVIAATVVLVVIGWLLIALVAGACWWIATGHLP